MIMLLSGGLDSIAAWRLLGCPAISFCLDTTASQMKGMEWEAIEWAEATFDLGAVQLRHLPMGEWEMSNGYVPYRNAILILAAAQMDPEVAIGQVAEWGPDKNRRFYRQLERMANRTGSLAGLDRKVKIVAPFANLSKGELLVAYQRTYGEQAVMDLVVHTWSCYRNKAVHCGECGGCIQRFNALCFAFGSPIQPFATQPEQLKIPVLDFVRWIRDNGIDGIVQVKAHERDRKAGRQVCAKYPRPLG